MYQMHVVLISNGVKSVCIGKKNLEIEKYHCYLKEIIKHKKEFNAV